MMRIIRRNLGFITAASLALVIGGSAVVVAQGPLPGFGPTGSDLAIDDQSQMRGRSGDFFGRGGRGFRGGFRAPLRFGMASDIIRTETIVDAGDDGFVTHRNEQGEVSAVSDSSLSVSLANGETSEIAVTDDTTILTIDSDSMKRRRRIRIVEASISDVGSGDVVMVTSRSTGDGAFEASRIVVMALTETDAAGGTDSSDDTDASAGTDAAAAAVLLSA
ncbi:MAG: hypothetical protein ACC726_14915 [Chloroflexota bacterium]